MGWVERISRGVLRLGLKAYFREIEVRGGEGVPREGPCLIAANHGNSLMDPFLLFAALDRPVAFIAKAPLFDKPVLGWFLRRLGCIPAHRRQDEGYSKEKNVGLYEASLDLLARGPALAIFPEGRSHSEPHLSEFRHGASRIALDAEARLGGMRILLVGIHFERRRGFRGKALLNLSPPIDVAAYRDAYAADPRAAVATLTADLQRKLSEYVLEADDGEILRLADLLARMRALEEGRPDDLPEAFDRKKRILDAYRALREREPAEVEALRIDLARYRELTGLLGVREEQVAADYRPGRVLAFAVKNTVLLALGLPFLAMGFAGNLLPYVAGWLVSRGTRDADVRATHGFLTALVAFPAWWAALAWAAFRWDGPAACVGSLVLCPITGLLALHWLDRWAAVARGTAGMWLAVVRPSARALLRRMRRRALRRAERLQALLGESN